MLLLSKLPLGPKMIVSIMGQLDFFENNLYLIGPYAKKKKNTNS